MKVDKRIFKFWFPVFLYSGIIFWASSQPPGGPLPWPFADKFLHLIEYSILGFLTARALHGSQCGMVAARIVLYAFLFSFLYGFSDEWHQSFVPGRQVEIGDLLADGIGGLLGGMIFFRGPH